MKNKFALFLVSGLAALPAYALDAAWSTVPVETPPVSIDALASQARGALVAPEISYAFSTAGSGSWSQEGGWSVWRYAVTVSGASSLAFHGDVELPQGALLCLLDTDGNEYQRLASAKSSANTYTPAIPGDTLRLEVRVPTSLKDSVLVQADKVFVGVKPGGFGAVAKSLIERVAQAAAASPDQGVGAVDNYACFDDSTNDKAGRATVMYTAYLPDGGALAANGAGTYQCTATLMNDVPGDRTMYLLTAAHCGFSSKDEAVNVDPSSVTVYWNAVAPCNTSATDQGVVAVNTLSVPTSTGATTIAVKTGTVQSSSGTLPYPNSQTGDMWLMKLDDAAPPAGSNAYFAGFDATIPQSTPGSGANSITNAYGETYYNPAYPANGQPNPSFGIHHDGGNSKQWSSSATNAVIQYAGYQITVNEGTSQDGASGSALFGSAQRVLGTLTGSGGNGSGGFAMDYYSVWDAWTGDHTAATQLSAWLDPAQTGTLAIDGQEAVFAPTVSISANEAEGTVGGVVTLTWSSTAATACTASGSWSGPEATSGMATITLTTAGLDTFTLTCSGAGGSANDSVTVVVNPASAGGTTGSTGAGGSTASSGGGHAGSLDLLGLAGLAFAAYRRKR